MDIAILQALEKIRCPFLNVFFGIFTALGEEFIIAGIIAVIYICFSKRTGEQALITVMSASCVTTGIKSAVRRLRPFAANNVSRVEIDNPFVSTLDLDADMSFPSGHATATSSFFTTMSVRCRKPLFIALFIVFTLLVMLSRLYLGVHYPTDVLCGLAIGLSFAFFWQFVYIKWFNARLYIYAAIAILTVPLLFIPSTATESMFQISAITLATSAGLLIENTWIRFEDTTRWLHRLFRLVICGASAGIPFLILHFSLPEGNWFAFITYFFALFPALTLAPFLFKKLKI